MGENSDVVFSTWRFPRKEVMLCWGQNSQKSTFWTNISHFSSRLLPKFLYMLNRTPCRLPFCFYGSWFSSSSEVMSSSLVRSLSPSVWQLIDKSDAAFVMVTCWLLSSLLRQLALIDASPRTSRAWPSISLQLTTANVNSKLLGIEGRELLRRLANTYWQRLLWWKTQVIVPGKFDILPNTTRDEWLVKRENLAYRGCLNEKCWFFIWATHHWVVKFGDLPSPTLFSSCWRWTTGRT